MTDSSDKDWYLQEWLAHFGKRQAALTNELGWNKSRAHFVFHGEQAYRRGDVNEVAKWLGIEPFELLMYPEQALALRRIRETAAVIVAGDVGQDNDVPPPPAKRAAS